MKIKRLSFHIGRGYVASRLVVLAILVLAMACQPTGAQVAPSGAVAPGATPPREWHAWQYSTFLKVYTSMNGVITPLSRLWISQKSPSPNVEPYGYMATSAQGQGRLQLDDTACNFYVYQKSHPLEFGADAIRTCSKSSTATGCKNYDIIKYKSSAGTMKYCPVKIVTLGGNITVKGTIVTIVEYPDLATGLTLVIVHEGAVEVTSAQTGDIVTIQAGQAAYFAAPQTPPVAAQDLATTLTGLYGFAPQEIVALDDPRLPPLLVDLEAISQIQRANVVVYGEGAIVPLGDATFVLSLRSPEYEMGAERGHSLAASLRMAVDWSALPSDLQPVPIAYQAWMGESDPNSDASPPAFTATLSGVANVADLVAADDLGQLGYVFEDLRNVGYDSTAGVGELKRLFAEMGYQFDGRELTIAYDSEDAMLLDPLARFLADQLSNAGLPTTTFAVDFTYYEGQVVQEKLDIGSPVLLLTYY